MGWPWLSWLLSLCVVQLLIILSLLNKQYGHHGERKASPLTIVRPSLQPVANEVVGSPQCPKATATEKHEKPSGVAATLLLHAPTWFQRRYTMMVQNAINNIPDDWKVQIFYTTSGQSQHGLDINPGIKRFIKLGKVVLTPIPDSVLTVKKKRFELMFEPWIWENMLAGTVLIFGGNAVICSNSPYSFQDFASFDYLGSPWDFKKGVGGDGGISIRNRQAMLAAIDYALQKEAADKRETAFRSWGQEDQFYVRTLLEMNQRAGSTGRQWKLASRNDTLRFSAIGAAVNNDVLVVSGTLPSVPYDDRQAFMNVCPEIKMFYPALHDPHCFGAEPDGDMCAKTVCALKPKGERRGGC